MDEAGLRIGRDVQTFGQFNGQYEFRFEWQHVNRIVVDEKM